MGKSIDRKELFWITIGFLASMVHWLLCTLFFVALVLYINQGLVGCVKGMIIVTTRGILSTAVSSGLNGITQMAKWGIIFLFSFYIIFYAMRYYQENICVKNLKIMLITFVWYIFTTSFFSSSYPVVSCFKAIAYAIPFYAVAAGVSVSGHKVNWIQYLYYILTPIIVLCIVTIPFARFKIVNESFQGVINHPNLMGIFGAIYFGVAIYNITYEEIEKKKLAQMLVLATFVMIYLSDSRTGMFSTVIILIIHLATLQGKSQVKAWIAIFVILTVSGVYFMEQPEVWNDVTEEVNQFVYKRDTDDILESRRGQVDMSQEKYDAHPMIGSGFSVPYEEGITDYQFSMSLTYEAGNIFLAVLGDCGILGSILFWGYMLYILFHTKRSKWSLCLLPVVVSFGEMAFFATNNIAIYYYLMYGICLARDGGR